LLRGGCRHKAGMSERDIRAPSGGFSGPVKRSITIAGHETSITLEPIFWRALEAAAARLALPLNALVATIDAIRIEADDPPNLASALRSWVLAQHLMKITRNSVDTANDSQ
jgi:predicted DNA-binding ribbon-helix-helix protein